MDGCSMADLDGLSTQNGRFGRWTRPAGHFGRSALTGPMADAIGVFGRSGSQGVL